jgi:Protein of unknown function (DUF3710)
VIFSRNRGNASRRSDGAAGRGGRHARTKTNGRNAPAADLGDDEFAADDETDHLEFGPYDVSEAPKDTLSRLDLGALRIPTVAGVDIQLEAAPSGEIQRVQLAYGGSRLQLGAFAAPRTEGIWDEIREELRTALVGGGAKLAEVDGEYGPELQARLGGGQGVVEVRHIGIDGPRWFVHGVYVGAAAVDPDQAGPLREALRGLVVDRGPEARPVKEPLPLRLPAEAAAQLAEIVSNDQAPGVPATAALGAVGHGDTARPSKTVTPPSNETGTPPAGDVSVPRSGETASRGGGTAARKRSRGGRPKRTANEAT